MICQISSKFRIFGQKYDFWHSVQLWFLSFWMVAKPLNNHKLVSRLWAISLVKALLPVMRYSLAKNQFHEYSSITLSRWETLENPFQYLSQKPFNPPSFFSITHSNLSQDWLLLWPFYQSLMDWNQTRDPRAHQFREIIAL